MIVKNAKSVIKWIAPKAIAAPIIPRCGINTAEAINETKLIIK
jgi:hypothetical protein